jgi:hypothetical protein
VTGTVAYELILGRAGAAPSWLDGAAGDDCLVAAGGSGVKISLTGGDGNDVCIAPSSAAVQFKECETQLTPAG